jgi:hypothetical protein
METELAALRVGGPAALAVADGCWALLCRMLRAQCLCCCLAAPACTLSCTLAHNLTQPGCCAAAGALQHAQHSTRAGAVRGGGKGYQRRGISSHRCQRRSAGSWRMCAVPGAALAGHAQHAGRGHGRAAADSQRAAGAWLWCHAAGHAFYCGYVERASAGCAWQGEVKCSAHVKVALVLAAAVAEGCPHDVYISPLTDSQ